MNDGRDMKEIISEVDADNVSPMLDELNTHGSKWSVGTLLLTHFLLKYLMVKIYWKLQNHKMEPIKLIETQKKIMWPKNHVIFTKFQSIIKNV